MRNKILYFIAVVLIFTITFIFPIKTDAKTYYANQSISSIIDTEILEPGDIIDLSNSSYFPHPNRFYIYMEDELVTDNCFGIEDVCQTQFVVENRMIFHNTNRKSGSEFNINFYKLKNNEEIKEIINLYQQETPQEHIDKYFKSGDLIKIIFEHTGVSTSNVIYDANGNILETNILDNAPKVLRLPKINNKDVYWINTIVRNGGIYNFPTSTFTPIEYTEPKIELKCDKDKINYGEKTKCEVCIECTHAINKLEFSMNQKDLKFSNYSFSNGVTNSGNNNSIKLNITDNNICNEKKTIMSFDVESTKDTNYLDTITLKDLAYRDEVLTGNYKNLDSNLNIISVKNNISNPKTGTRLLFIIIPIILISIIGGLSLIRRKKYEN